jgi:hypothetical protein
MKYNVTGMGEIDPCYLGLRVQLPIDCGANLRGMWTIFRGTRKLDNESGCWQCRNFVGWGRVSPWLGFGFLSM